MPFKFIETDITRMDVDVIVNAANEALQQGGGVCGAIFQAAGEAALQAACDEIGSCPAGEAVITEGFNLLAKKVIHTVGPIWQGGAEGEAVLLRRCYENSLQLAYDNELESIAFPLISSGIYGYPIMEAFEIAVSTIRTFLENHELTVYLVIFDKNQLRQNEFKRQSIENYLHLYYEETVYRQQGAQTLDSHIYEVKGLEEVLHQLDDSFAERLLKYIDEKGMTDVETYKKANIDRRLFSKIRNSPDYTPKKKTVLAFAIALELDVDETLDLLEKAGYTLSPSSKFDLIIRYFIEEETYDVFTINEALFGFGEVLLGS